MIREVNEAYDILSDPVRKAVYDGRGTKRTSFAYVYVYQEDPMTKHRRAQKGRGSAEKGGTLADGKRDL
jgi:curved DNA-binding protein CbpA